MSKPRKSDPASTASAADQHRAAPLLNQRLKSALQSLDVVEIEKLLKDSDQALQQVDELSRNMREMKEICRLGSASPGAAIGESQQQAFERLKEKSMQLIDAKSLQDPASADLAARSSASESSSGTSATATNPADQEQAEKRQQQSQIIASSLACPDFSSYRTGLLTNAGSVTQLDQQSFLSRLQKSRDTRLHKQATVQGVRIRARQPKQMVQAPCRAINSLSPVTGVSTSIVGNALFAKTRARATGIPLSKGDIVINDVAIPAIEGGVEDLLLTVNEKTPLHGIHVAQLQDQTLVFESLEGRSIKLSIRSQSAAIMTGLSMGVQNLPARSCGLLVWLMDATDELKFDCEQTSLALNGCKASNLPMKRLGIADLSCESTSNAQLSLAILERLYQLLAQQQKLFYRQLKNACEEISQSVDKCVGGVSESVAALELRLQDPI